MTESFFFLFFFLLLRCVTKSLLVLLQKTPFIPRIRRNSVSITAHYVIKTHALLTYKIKLFNKNTPLEISDASQNADFFVYEPESERPRRLREDGGEN